MIAVCPTCGKQYDPRPGQVLVYVRHIDNEPNGLHTITFHDDLPWWQKLIVWVWRFKATPEGWK